MSLPIRIMTRGFNLLGETSRYESLQITRSWHGIGLLEMRINRYMKHADKLQRGHIIFPHNHLNKGYIIRHKEIELDENGKITENWIIRALSLKSWMAQRLTYPPSHTAYDNISGNAESVMLHYVNNNVIDPADPDRVMQDIVLSENLNRGPNISWQSRYKNLANELENISLQTGIGWNIEIDYENKQYIFKILEGRDVTANQSGLPPAIFSPEFGSLGYLSFTESELDYKNLAVVGGQGEGANRRIVLVGDDSSGYDRYEMFVDARDVGEGEEDDPRPEQEITNDLINRGEQKLKEHEQEIYLEGQALSESHIDYEHDYDLGDFVTLQNKEWNVTMDARITEVTEIYERDSPRRLEFTFGNDIPTLIDKIKREIDQPLIETSSNGGEGGGEPGRDGVGLEFDWRGTELGVKREDEPNYSYEDLQGPQGEQGPEGPQGEPGTTDYMQLENIPSSFPPSSHEHGMEDLEDFRVAGGILEFNDGSEWKEVASDTTDLEQQIDTVEQEFDAHKADVATESELGHVMVDGESIISNNGIISTFFEQINLYYEGDECEQNTDGWAYYVTAGASGTSGSKNSDHLAVGVTENATSSKFVTKNPIDFNGLKKLKIELEGVTSTDANTSSVRVILHEQADSVSVTGVAYLVLEDEVIERDIYELNVAGIQGDYHVSLLARNGGAVGLTEGKFYRVWGEG